MPPPEFGNKGEYSFWYLSWSWNHWKSHVNQHLKRKHPFPIISSQFLLLFDAWWIPISELMRYSSSACQVVSVGAGTILANGGDPQIVIAVNADHRSYAYMKMGYTPNYSHLVGIMIINHWVRGTQFSDTPIWSVWKWGIPKCSFQRESD